ncbi:MAG: glycosyltransferase family 4 protein [Pseudomonadota bacterium]
MKLGVVNYETWGFFNEIFAEFQSRYDTTVHKRRTLKLPFIDQPVPLERVSSSLQRFMQANDVVFFEWASSHLAIASQLPKSCRIVTRLHRYEMYGFAEQINWDNVDEIILVSAAKEAEFLEKFPAQARKTHVIGASVDLRKFEFLERHYSGHLGTLCHIGPRKRVYELILDTAPVLKSHNLKLFVAGGASAWHEDYMRAIRSLIKMLDVEDHVILEGHVDNPETWYGNIDVFISHSYSEGLQVAPMEAMAMGCYCVSHRWEGAEELVAQENTYLTASELSSLLRHFHEASDDERIRLCHESRAFAMRNFDIVKTVESVCAVVDRAAARSG